MSTSTPTSTPARRRRIAGERRGARPSGPAAPERSTPRSAAPEPAPAAAQPTGGRSTPGRWGSARTRLALAGALAVVLTLGALAALGLLGTPGFAQLAEADEVDRAAAAAPAAAEEAAAAILAYDHRHLEADRRRAAGFMSERFAGQYADTFEKVVAPAAEQTRARVTAEVRGSGVVRAGADRVRVLLFVDQTTVSTANQGPQQALNRVEMVMVRDGDRWLVDDVTSY